MANGLDFCEGNVVKYVTVGKQKGGVVIYARPRNTWTS